MKLRIFPLLLVFNMLVVGSWLMSCGNDDDDDDDDTNTADDDTASLDDDTGDDDTDDDSVADDDGSPSAEVWRPEPGTAWQWQLTGIIDTSYDVRMYDIDLFNVSEQTIQNLHGDGRIVICYFSAGSYEDWREDAGEFPDDALGNPLDGWAGEWWLDINNSQVRQIMQERLDRAVDKGCNGVEPDNVDGYANANGLGLTAADQLDYNRFIADQAHQRGLSVGLKNDIDQLEKLVDWFDWALNEECATYNECYRYDVFLNQNRAVFHTEYVDDWSDAQAKADEVCLVKPELDTIIKLWDLNAKRLACE